VRFVLNRLAAIADASFFCLEPSTINCVGFGFLPANILSLASAFNEIKESKEPKNIINPEIDINYLRVRE